MIYKVIVSDEKDFERLKLYSYYNSPRTRVMCFDMDTDHEVYHIVAKYFINDDVKMDILTYPVTYNNGVFIQSEDKELAGFLGSWVKNGYIKVSVAEWWKIFLLLKNGTIVPDQSFKDRFTPVKRTDNINQMKSWSMKVQFRGPGWNFKDCAMKSLKFNGEKGIQIASCKFLKDGIVDRNYTIVNGYVMDVSTDKKQILFRDEKGEVYNLQIKGWPFRFNTDIWRKDVKLSFYCTGKGTEIFNPTIIPKCLGVEPRKINDYLNEFGYLSNRACPTELLNRLKAEVCIRLYLNGDKL